MSLKASERGSDVVQVYIGRLRNTGKLMNTDGPAQVKRGHSDTWQMRAALVGGAWREKPLRL